MNESQAQPLSASGRNGQPGTLSDRVRSLRLPDRPVRPSGGSSTLPWILCGVLVGTAGYLGYRVRNAEQALAAQGEEDLSPAGPTSPGGGAPGETAAPASRQQLLETGGYLVPLHRVQVSPKVGGQVLKLHFEEGERVQKGQELARIDPTKYEFVYRERKAQADVLKAEWEKLQVSLELEERLREAAVAEGQAQLNLLLDRRSILMGARSAVSQEELNEVGFQIEQAREKVNQLRRSLQLIRDTRLKDLERAQSSYEQAQAQADSAKYDLDNCVVLAPSDGIILKKYAEEGNMVRPEAFSNGLSASLYDMANLRLMEVDVDISEQDLGFVRRGQRCDIRTEAFSDRIYKGYVSRLMPEADRSKASVSARVRLEIPEGDTLLRPEMRARVRFFADEADRAGGEGARRPSVEE